MASNIHFSEHLQEYDSWFERHPAVYQSELAALRSVWPEDEGLRSLQIGAATGRFASELHVTEALDPEPAFLQKAGERGVPTFPGRAEDLPYASSQFDVILMGTSIHYYHDPAKALKEAYRVMKNGGKLIVAFINEETPIGKEYKNRGDEGRFYPFIHSFKVADVEARMRKAGFVKLRYSQTLFGSLSSIQSLQTPAPGYGEGAYTIITAEKPGYVFPWSPLLAIF